MRIAVLTCLYPGVENFVPEFVQSLVGQSRTDFTLLVLNDGVANCTRLFRKTPFKVQVLSAEGTPARIRKKGIEWASENGFESVIFADSDDCFAPSRIEESVQLLKDTAIVFNDLILFGAGLSGEESMYGARLSQGERVGIDSLLTCNLLGLSNTASRVSSILDAALRTSDDTIAFDWALFTRVLAAGTTALYTTNTCTYYRQHDANIAAPGALSEYDIRRGVTVKSRHYSAVSDLGNRYRDLALRFACLEEKMEADSHFARQYCAAVQDHLQARPLWWENIRTAEELSL